MLRAQHVCVLITVVFNSNMIIPASPRQPSLVLTPALSFILYLLVNISSFFRSDAPATRNFRDVVVSWRGLCATALSLLASLYLGLWTSRGCPAASPFSGTGRSEWLELAASLPPAG